MPDDPNPDSPKQKPGSVEEISSALGGIHEPAIRVAVPGKPDLLVWLQGVPAPLLRTVENLTRPSSLWKTILKDYLPVLTPIASVVISVLVFNYTRQVNKRASINASSERVAKLINELGPKSTGVNGGEKDRARTIAAMKVAAYGGQALLAVRMALGADDDEIRNGGVLVAEQIYRAGTVEHQQLTREILSYYDTPNSVLRRGVLEWLDEMGHQLSEGDASLAFARLTLSFGSNGQLCTEQDGQVARAAANFLFTRPFKDSKNLVLGMVKNCTDGQQPDRFEEARAQALDALPKIARLISKEERTSVVAELRKIETPSKSIQDKITFTIGEINEIR